jgi:hypothetical protein
MRLLPRDRFSSVSCAMPKLRRRSSRLVRCRRQRNGSRSPSETRGPPSRGYFWSRPDRPRARRSGSRSPRRSGLRWVRPPSRPTRGCWRSRSAPGARRCIRAWSTRSRGSSARGAATTRIAARAPWLRDRGGHAWRAPGRGQPPACAARTTARRSAWRPYAEFGSRDLLERVALEQMLVGASARRYRRTQEPIGAEAEAESRPTSKSAVSRAFVTGNRGARRAALAAPR